MPPAVRPVTVHRRAQTALSPTSCRHSGGGAEPRRAHRWRRYRTAPQRVHCKRRVARAHYTCDLAISRGPASGSTRFMGLSWTFERTL
jgi:hypothetical protein